MRALLPTETLQATYTPLGVDRDYQAETLGRLRGLEMPDVARGLTATT